jgi:CheY-like chemotaxis protein
MTKRILVVDDEADVRRFLTAVLEKRGHETLTAADGREAFEIAEREHPDLVILDLQMPNQTGTDFYRRLMKHKDLGNIPIIVVSGLAGRHLAVREPVAVFDKPIDPEEFGATVDRALGIDNGVEK